MKQPNGFFAGNRLVIPTDVDTEVMVELVRESKPVVFDLGALAVLRLHLPYIPRWTERKDKTSGVLHVMDSEHDTVISLAHSVDGVPDGAYNTDGVLFRQGRDMIATLGVLEGDEIHVWWGITSLDSFENVDPASVDTHSLWLASPELIEFHHKKFSQETL